MYNSDMPNRADLPSKRKLLRSTILAAVSAAALLVTVILPAEYGVDPTGVGRVLGLTEMGQIKEQLAQEAASAEAVEAVEEVEVAEEITPVIEVPDPVADTAPVEPLEIMWRDETSITLKPGAAAEVKLVMVKGNVAHYEWATDQGHLNSDLHTDGGDGKTHSYKQGRAETVNAGEFTAISEGAHGWFWRNRSDKDVTVTLRVKGDYSELKRTM
ncbi:MAG: transmembrane anchor protein [Acidimicrobiales bacterium]|nr:transmembrane anchor protein [Hyphomonadaceae bacterium]RZV42164.1 MAG: transmembrane anchor protein [Acidimicrobiales bacterium]